MRPNQEIVIDRPFGGGAALVINIRLSRWARARLLLGVCLLHLAGWVMGAPVEIDLGEDKPISH